MDGPLFPLVLYFLATVTIVAFIVALSALLGQRHHERATDEPYESGVQSTGTVGGRFDVKFYLIAMFFLIFDVEAVYLYIWALSVREIGWTGYVEVLLFTGVFAVAFMYILRQGALDWGKVKSSRKQ
ncbi:MAG: NADH-quinone oxidoreductase subunit A [Nitrospirota bacterium]|nr:NADH-quinone oxidoreductase subunit A [Nitrospirota bacterium]